MPISKSFYIILEFGNSFKFYLIIIIGDTFFSSLSCLLIPVKNHSTCEKLFGKELHFGTNKDKEIIGNDRNDGKYALFFLNV